MEMIWRASPSLGTPATVHKPTCHELRGGSSVLVGHSPGNVTCVWVCAACRRVCPGVCRRVPERQLRPATRVSAAAVLFIHALRVTVLSHVPRRLPHCAQVLL